MKIFNTMTRKKEELTPLVPGEYRIYVCGPTVYNYVHIGNARPVVVFDTLRRYLEYQGNRVLFVSNITDIDDKIIAKANEAGVSMQEYAGRYEAEFLKDCDGLNALPPTVRPAPRSTSTRYCPSWRTSLKKATAMWPKTATCISALRNSRNTASFPIWCWRTLKAATARFAARWTAI